jgi:ubiquinone/menaquinone biosynthesis C-methylase UbiE
MKRLYELSLSGLVLALAVFVPGPHPVVGQEKSVRPGINKPFDNPDVKDYLGKFEVESREIFAKRQEIVTACKLRPGMAVADIGAGTGMFTRLFAKEVGPSGKVMAVDIAPKFIHYIEKTCQEHSLQNVVGVVCKPDSVELPAHSIDLAFICDTYHHFEFPFKTMASIHRALRTGGQVILLDFHRLEGKSSDWVLNHVRAGQDVFTQEIKAAGFKQVEEAAFLKENYFVRFEKVERLKEQERKATAQDPKKPEVLVREQFAVLRSQGLPPLIPIADETLARIFPQYCFFALLFRQYPVAQVPPEPLSARNLFAVKKDGKVQHLTDTKALEEFFRGTLGLVTDGQSAKDSAEAWLRLTEELKQDGFFKFSIPKELLTAVRSKSGWRASGRAIVTQGGKGEIGVALSFTGPGQLTTVEETNTVKAGVRPICQATKLLDPDPIVGRMAEQDILVMGRAAKEYLDEQRAKASPALQLAIDRIWQRIVDEGW